MENAKELIRSASELNLDHKLLTQSEAEVYIQDIFTRFKVGKTTGHLAIWHESQTLPLNEYEYKYSEHLPDEPVYVFFEQQGLDKNAVVILTQGKMLGKVVENSFGMEYFVSDASSSFLIAVNWYAIEIAGAAKEYFHK
ncbi:MAG: hypothetical protein FD123_2564 [Bacteroidetes bacterium]|nr:MAG: hypothetical protein FD123_2564 [Bacteroidota bacterium]